MSTELIIKKYPDYKELTMTFGVVALVALIMMIALAVGVSVANKSAGGPVTGLGGMWKKYHPAAHHRRW